MAIAHVKIGVNPSNFAGIAQLAQAVITGLTGNMNFATPMPTIVTLQMALTALQVAIAKWGVVGNRGSHADYVDLVAKATYMRNLLLLEGDYVNNQVDPLTSYATQAALITSSGFSVRNLPNPQGVLGPAENLHRHMDDSISEDDIFLQWEKPLGLTSPNNVKIYKIQMDGIEIGTSTKTSFLVTPANGIIHGNPYSFVIIGNNAAGDGVPTAPLVVNY